MNRFPGKTAAATLLAAVAALTMTACSSSASHPASQPSAPAVSSASSSGGSAGSSGSAPASAAQIVISNFDFSPMALTVAPGQTVTVVNKDSTTHTLTAATGKAFDTGDIAPGKTGTFTAPTTPGTYSYICTIHQFMHGTLTVRS